MQTLKQLQSGELKGIKHLKIAEDLTYFPSEIFGLADSLEILDLSKNKLSSLPAEFGTFKKLKIVFLSENEFTELPEVLGACPALEMIGFKTNKITRIPPKSLPENLKWLILTDNQISEIPGTIGKCAKLQKLMLAGNKLTKLPQELSLCRNLELLRISANNLQTLPEWLFDLPKLAWLAFAGNPEIATSTQAQNLPEINWESLKLEEKLGEGASGIISKAIWKDNQGIETEVAVKVFKGHVTSDGFPADEMKATLATGIHSNIVQVLGKITDHPGQKSGLVLKLIPPTYKNLGNPPSFETCTRDTYPNGTKFALESAVNIAEGIASAAAHLHANGIMHGDLYAHNILTENFKNPLFGDFGAATIYDRKNKDLANSLEKLEVRAFGYLLEDLLNHLSPEISNPQNLNVLAQIKTACLQVELSARPDFKTICGELKNTKISYSGNLA